MTITERHQRQQEEAQAIRNWDGRKWLALTMFGHHLPIVRPVKQSAHKYVYELQHTVDANGKVKGIPYINHEKRAKRALKH